jgi:hypothetical protein
MVIQKKRGLSEVVTVALIILLAIAAVVIVWTFVRSTLTDVGEQVTSVCLTTNLETVSCSSTAVLVKYASGDKPVNSVKLTYFQADGTSSIVDGGTNCQNINVGETKSCAVALPAGAVSVAVAPVVGTNECPATSSKVDCA